MNTSSSDNSYERQSEAPAEPIIEVTHVYKQYRYGQYNLSLRQEADKVFKRLFGFYTQEERHTPLYALQDVNFSIHQGEAVGIIGANGAGKTTLLRLLSGITKPTQGTVSVRGRFATLIGLNAGFNPDMSGRKNIYLNAAIFGTSIHDTQALEEAIIRFADIGDFIDLPTKVYSSGMAARLGFSIAVHILPEIIFIDEILAVGDAEFAAKCTERLVELKTEGRTIVMVSHALGSIRSLSERCLWLNKGTLMMDGATEAVTAAYEAHNSGSTNSA